MNWIPALSTTAGFALILWLLRSWISVRLTNAVRYEYDKELEKLKAELSSKASQIDSIRSGTLSSLHNRQALKYRRAMDSAEAIWASTVKLGGLKHLSELFALYDPEKMAKEAARNERFKEMFEIMDKGININEFKGQEPENLRIYASPLAWSLYSAYRAILLNSYARLQQIKLGIEKDYTKNKEVLNTAKAALPQHEHHIDEQGIKCLHFLLDEIENSLLFEIKKMINGDDSDQESIEKSARINAAVEDLTKNELPHNKRLQSDAQART